uniref:Uncharacterized protein n=1 Tax=Cacopsylla melanoneura TaxID=428564 RepID=A0A8D8QUE9_9HEMI
MSGLFDPRIPLSHRGRVGLRFSTQYLGPVEPRDRGLRFGTPDYTGQVDHLTLLVGTVYLGHLHGIRTDIDIHLEPAEQGEVEGIVVRPTLVLHTQVTTCQGNLVRVTGSANPVGLGDNLEVTIHFLRPVPPLHGGDGFPSPALTLQLNQIILVHMFCCLVLQVYATLCDFDILGLDQCCQVYELHNLAVFSHF